MEKSGRLGDTMNKGLQLAWNGAVGLLFLGILTTTMVINAVIEDK